MYPALLKELLRNRAAAAGLVILVLAVSVALFGHFWFPGDPWEMAAAPMP